MREHSRHLALPVVRRIQLVAGLGDAREHADMPTMLLRERLARVAGVLDHTPTTFDEQPLLRIDVQRLARGDAEEQRIECSEVGDEATPLAVAASTADRALYIGFMDLRKPPALGWNLFDAIAARAQVLPVFVHISGLRIAAADADDGDCLMRYGCLRAHRCRGFVLDHEPCRG